MVYITLPKKPTDSPSPEGILPFFPEIFEKHFMRRSRGGFKDVKLLESKLLKFTWLNDRNENRP